MITHLKFMSIPVADQDCALISLPYTSPVALAWKDGGWRPACCELHCITVPRHWKAMLS